jgi:hypothetical protein
MRQLARLGTAGLFIAIPIALAAAPAWAADGLLQPAEPTSVLRVPALPLPEVSVPSLPEPSLPVPEVPVPDPPDVPDVPDIPVVPDVPDVPDEPLPGVSLPKLSSTKQSPPRTSEQGEQSGSQRQDAKAAAGTPASGAITVRGGIDGSANARPVIAQVDHAQAARTVGVADEFLLGLVHDELCVALRSLLVPMPDTVNGLPPRVIAQLPPEVVNVVPPSVLARATVRCSSEDASGAGGGSADEGPLTRVLGLHPFTGMRGAAALPLGLALLSLGIGLRVAPASNAQNKPA